MIHPDKRKEYIRTIAFMAIVTLIAISAVSALHIATEDVVMQNDSLYRKAAVLQAAGMDIPIDRDALLTLYDSCATNKGPETEGHYIISDPASGVTTGHVLIRQGAGLWGTVQLAVGLKADGQTLSGIAVLKQNETPGLGARIAEAWFQEQFDGKGRKDGEPLKFVAERTRSETRNEFDAVTGATITTRAVRDILNRTLEEAPQLLSTASAERSN